MKILILTPINPVIAETAYTAIANSVTEEESKYTDFICIPFFADVDARMKGKEYLPNLFAMFKAAEEKKMNKKLFASKHTVVIGNFYKSTEFDIVVSLEYDEEELPFDAYLAALESDEESSQFRDLIRTYDLYKIEDCEIHLPTIDHAKLFIKGVIEQNEPDTKPKEPKTRRTSLKS